MTAIATIISSSCIAFASDSFITIKQQDGIYKPLEYEKSKIIRYEGIRAAAAYWGLSTVGNYWSTPDWLSSKIADVSSFNSLDDFAKHLCVSLDKELNKINFNSKIESGIGIHLAGYEKINDYWIPELFLISNFLNPTYTELRKLGCSRETYHTINRVDPEDFHREYDYRIEVHKYLHGNNFLYYNNGDPQMYNPAANALIFLLQTSASRGSLKELDDVNTYRAIAKRPIEIIAAAQRDFCKEGYRLVGGKIHDLVIENYGNTFSSHSGD